MLKYEVLFVVVDSLTITNQTAEDMITVREDRTIQFNSLQFRWDYILIYISLRFLQGGGAGKESSCTLKDSEHLKCRKHAYVK